MAGLIVASLRRSNAVSRTSVGIASLTAGFFGGAALLIGNIMIRTKREYF
jgi:hypothetical protein